MLIFTSSGTAFESNANKHALRRQSTKWKPLVGLVLRLLHLGLHFGQHFLHAPQLGLLLQQDAVFLPPGRHRSSTTIHSAKFTQRLITHFRVPVLCLFLRFLRSTLGKPLRTVVFIVHFLGHLLQILHVCAAIQICLGNYIL